MTVGILQAFVPNEGDAWQFTLDALSSFLERVLTEKGSMDASDVPVSGAPLIALAEAAVPPEIADMVGPYLQSAERLGERTAGLHAALASAVDDPAFAPEPITPFYQQSIYQSMRALVARVFPLLEKKLDALPEAARLGARRVLALEPQVLARFQTVTERKIGGMRLRCHGDYHLGQVLFTGKDFVIIDFEGEPARPLSERRLKRSPLRDVAGMLRSFHYAACAALANQLALGVVSTERLPAVEAWLDVWQERVSAAFLRAYMAALGGLGLLPIDRDEIGVLLDAFILEKAVYELGYELNNRPDWVNIPLRGILQQLEAG